MKEDGSGQYNPAYMLPDWTKERAGRGASSIKPARNNYENVSRGEIDEVPGCDLKEPPA